MTSLVMEALSVLTLFTASWPIEGWLEFLTVTSLAIFLVEATTPSVPSQRPICVARIWHGVVKWKVVGEKFGSSKRV